MQGAAGEGWFALVWYHTISLLQTERFKWKQELNYQTGGNSKGGAGLQNETLKIFKCFFIVSNRRCSEPALLVARGLLYSQLQELYSFPNNLETMAPQRTTFSTKEFSMQHKCHFAGSSVPGNLFVHGENGNCELTANGLNMPWADKFQICHFSQ